MPGVAERFKLSFYKRFELNSHINEKRQLLEVPDGDFKKIYNMYMAQNFSINNDVFELMRYNLIRIFLIKSFRGRCSALGKPNHGQRTHSNSSTNKNLNQTIRFFLQQVRKNNVIQKKPETLNRKYLKKKSKIKAPKIKIVFIKKKKNIWF